MKKILITLLSLAAVCTFAERFLVDYETKIPFELAVSMGLVDGASSLDKFGFNAEITTSTDPEDIWEYGGTYTYDTDNTAPILYFSSSSLADTNMSLNVTGLDINGVEVMQSVAMDGTNVVTLTTALWRSYRIDNPSSSVIVGTVYCHTNAAPTAGVPATGVRAIIDAANNQTQMAIYTVPAAKVGLVYELEFGVELEGGAAALAEYAHFHFETRKYGGVFHVKKALSCIVGGNATYQDTKPIPFVVSALTDVKLKVELVSATMGAWGTFDVILIDEDRFTSAFLTSIGQPGY